MERKRFIDTYAKHLQRGSAGLFVGAGLSMAAGYPSWRSLVGDMAKDIGLDADVETDLVGLVQYYLNKERTRTKLASTIMDHFGEEKPIPAALRILARLPLRSLWTTNYDTLLERAWRDQRKKLDVKSRNVDVASEDPWAHAVLYKMHGTVDSPSEVVIAKGDYESFRRTRSGFLHLLAGQFVSRHMLFVGLSLTDPNLTHLFMLMREAFEDAPPEHFAILARPKKADGEDDEKFEYRRRKHDHWVDDLRNYGVDVVGIDDHGEIEGILEAVERRLAMTSVMVSGSFPDTREPAHADERARIEEIALGVGALIANRKLRFVSGFGLVVGSAALSGALTQINNQGTPNFERSLLLRPFPQLIPAGWERAAYYRRYREDLATEAGACVFISGVKTEGGGHVVANGVIEEFRAAVAAGRYPVPVGASGGAAREVWEMVDKDYDGFLGTLPRSLFAALNEPAATPGDLIAAVGAILDWLERNDPLG